MNLKQLHSVHFLGIGGIGMSALARWFRQMGMSVSGYDRTSTPLTDALTNEGMEIHFVDAVENIPSKVMADKSNTLIVWTPAIPQDSAQLKFFSDKGFQLKKRAVVLGLITAQLPTIAVAGTHGKTTTSSLIAHLLKFGGKNTAAFLGGISQNYNSNLILHNEERGNATVVVEADEFDRSFLQLHPNIAVVTSADPDHLDIYGDDREMIKSFNQFTDLIAADGKLYIQSHAFSRLNKTSYGKIKVRQYGLHSGEISAGRIQALPGAFRFDYISESTQIQGLELSVPGFHNVENALPAIAIALDHGIKKEIVKAGLASYRGVKRRFEIWLNEPDRVYIDDYAHHPEEIRAFLSSVRAMYPAKKLTAVFQPHLFTRTRDFAEGFSESLSLADEVILLDIYPAREKPIEGVSAGMLLAGITSQAKSLQTKENLLEYLKSKRPEVLVTLGAGDIDRLVLPIVNLMKAYEN